MNANPPTVLPGSFFLKKNTLQLFLSRSEVVHVIRHDIIFLNMILTFSQMMDWLCNSSLH